MAVEAVVSVVIQNVTYLLIQEPIFFSKAINEVEDIRLELRRIRGFLTYAKENQETKDADKKGSYAEENQETKDADKKGSYAEENQETKDADKKGSYAEENQETKDADKKGSYAEENQETKDADKKWSYAEENQETKDADKKWSNAEENQEAKDADKKWIPEYLETLYNVEDIVESYVLKLVRKKTGMGLLKNYGFYFHDWAACQNLRRKMKHIKEKLTKLEHPKNASSKSISYRQHSASQVDSSHKSSSFSQTKRTLSGAYEEDDSGFVGFEHDEKLLEKWLTSEEKIRELEPPVVKSLNSKSIPYRQHSASQVDISHKSSSFSQTKRTFSGAYEEDDLDFVGFKDNEELKKRLTSKNDWIIGVVGPLGSGKTTLVKRLYNCKSIKEQFSTHVWLNVSEEHVYKDLLLRVWNQVNKDRDTELTVLDEGQLQDNLKKFLHDKKKYLIVLDDVRQQPGAWKKLIENLPHISGCKVVLVTRQDDIVEEGQSLKLQRLSDKESSEFLTRLCPHKGSDLFSGQTSLWHEIVKKCQGLPLNIILLGGFLSTKKMSSEEFTRLCNQTHWSSMEFWQLSYNDLPAHYKLCLLYLTLFPKEFDLSVRRILRLWLAEGFIQGPPRMGEESEDLAEECFNDLVKRNLVKVSKFRSDGGPRKCYLPGFLRDQLSPKAQEISLYRIHHISTEQRPQQTPAIESSNSMEQSNLPKVDVRRIVEYADIKDYACDSNVQNLRSYLSFNYQRYDTPAKGVGDFLRKLVDNKGFGLLKVLDLEGVYKPILPETLKHLVMLRYLGLRWTFLDNLPKSVGDLPYLETLDLKGTYINTLPSSVWKLKHLRHLNLPRVRLNMNVQQPSSKLLTLWGLIIDDNCNIEKGLNQYYDLRELGIICQLKDYDKLLEWITELRHLQSLSLTSQDKMGRPSDLDLQRKESLGCQSNLDLQRKLTFSELHKLLRLKLLGKLSSLPEKSQFPPNLRVLTLSVSNLEEDPMVVLSQLRCLSVLRLLAKSYNGEKMQCPENGFRNLFVLKLWMLDNLKELVVKQGGMPKIRELHIRRCQTLEELPNELLQRTTLKELILTNMPSEFENNVRVNKSKHTSLQTNSFEFTPLPWEKDPELWD